VPESDTQIPTLNVPGTWESVFQPSARSGLEAILPRFLEPRRWFAGKARHIQSVGILDAIAVPQTSPLDYIVLIKVVYTEGTPDIYVVPLAFVPDQEAGEIAEKLPTAVVARLRCQQEEGFLYEALAGKSLAGALLEAIAHRRQLRGTSGKILARPTRAFKKLRGAAPGPLESSTMKVEQSNTSIVYADRLILKIFRRLQEGINPDVEIGTFLTERTTFRHFPPVAGTLAYQRGQDQAMSMAILQAFVPNEGDAWHYTLRALRDYLGRVADHRAELEARLNAVGEAKGDCSHASDKFLGDLLDREPPALAGDLVGSYLESARLLGKRTAEMHMALASDSSEPGFAPEPFTEAYQQSLYESMRDLAGKVFQLVRNKHDAVPEFAREQAARVLGLEEELLGRFRSVLDHKIKAVRTRIHGDFHLGQVLHTAKDFVIIDFEGEPGRSMRERRVKVSPLRDVAGMVRSFQYAAYSALIGRKSGGTASENLPALEFWTQCWYTWSCSAFLRSYLEVAGQAPFVPQTREELEILLRAYLLDKAVYELGYELNNRPDWVQIPLQGILQLLEPAS
jgi:maltose alpha-D-glucosyltransferase / alpha-amylase